MMTRGMTLTPVSSAAVKLPRTILLAPARIEYQLSDVTIRISYQMPLSWAILPVALSGKRSKKAMIAPPEPTPWKEKSRLEKVLTIGLPAGVGALLIYFLVPVMLKCISTATGLCE